MSKFQKFDVKSGRTKDAEGKPIPGKVVATIDIEIFDSVQEASLKLSESAVLALINTQYATNLKNKARAEATGQPSSKALRDDAFRRLLSTPEGTAQLTSVAADPTRFEALITDTINAIKTEKGIVTSAAGSEDDEDETEPA